jgi:2-C-methyl-D-erythritol 4-phosphate cytidylyltransferase
MVSAIILAAGSSSRMGGENKQFMTIGGEPVLRRSVQAFLWVKRITEVLVVCRKEDWGAMDDLLHGLPRVRVVPCGGETRQRSVENALEYVYPLSDMIAIHDGARPLVRPEDIEKTLDAAEKTGGALLGVMTKDTVKQVWDGLVVSTPDRREIFIAQTPQVFRLEDYRIALQAAKAQGLDLTDDAQLFEQAELPVAAVLGHYDNIKITTPEDIPAAEAMLALQPKWELPDSWDEDF